MKVYGHRGAAGEAPENTIAGCRHAIERGTRYLELDLRLSADEQLVVVHDKNVNRTTYNSGAVNSFTARELATMDARRSGTPWPRKKGAGIPTLDALLKATPEIKGYQLEVKSNSGATMEHIARLLADKFSSPGKSKKIVVTSSNQHLHNNLRALAPHIPLGLVSMRPDALRQLEEFDFQQLVLSWDVCYPSTVRHARRQGVSVAVWTANDPQLIKTLYKLKVDSVITDYPSMALPLVASLRR